MELILWRHAEAEEGEPDLERRLTSRGRKHADQMAQWLLQRLPSRFLVIASPAARAQQTADALGVRFKTSVGLAPGRPAAQLLEAVGWPAHKGAVVVVGHQPTLGRVAARLVGGTETEWSIKKAGLWWLVLRERHGEHEVLVRSVMAPELL
jgi:phosphohistidine phosphatase